jgi:hypothetical protein
MTHLEPLGAESSGYEVEEPPLVIDEQKPA